MSVFSTIRKGLDTVAAYPELVVPPILLDLFLWFGPRLTSRALFQRIADLVSESIRTAPTLDTEFSQQMAAQLDLFIELVGQFGERFNIFWGLSNFPIAVPSSMIGILPFLPGRMPLANPLGRPMIIEIPMQIPAIVLVSLPILVVGMGLGTLYHRWIASKTDQAEELVPFFIGWIRVLLLAALLGSVGFVLMFGILFVVGLVNLILGPQIGILVMGLGFSLLLGAIIYLFFTPYAIIRNRRNILIAMLDSFNIVRINIIGTLFYLLTAGGLLHLTNMVWLMPEDGSWYTLLGIVGHGFISSVLIASGYIFYQDRMVFLENLKKRLFSA